MWPGITWAIPWPSPRRVAGLKKNLPARLARCPSARTPRCPHAASARPSRHHQCWPPSPPPPDPHLPSSQIRRYPVPGWPDPHLPADRLASSWWPGRRLAASPPQAQGRHPTPPPPEAPRQLCGLPVYPSARPCPETTRTRGEELAKEPEGFTAVVKVDQAPMLVDQALMLVDKSWLLTVEECVHGISKICWWA
ncbi:hypothetical protein PAHAL_2G084900 [Panicum hallii]|uniref:Uncharacterized protein n=1 Tax=Panicum hallii TaxID=206008 RepID=A0A2T8KNC4_9POAL|nr:hypothetical protein PAHAL_2G084900 [Panicum hallii]PVH63685.1 hypothetical protein PAHAL_2G084900 [Panicum hallii]